MFRLLALDFDGVISDSAPEAFVVALRTYRELREGTRLATLEDALGAPAAPAPGRIAGEPLYAGFLEMMALGNRAEDYGAELLALEEDKRIPDQEAYDRHKDAIDAAWLRAYHKRFYQLRAEMLAADAEGWHRLIAPYDPFLDILRRHAGEVVMAVATSKDRRSVGILLQAYGVAHLFPDGHVLDKETGANKAAHLEHLHERLGIDYSEMVFIDDKVNHLDAVAPLGVRCALAGWGYNGEREARLARDRGYLVCGLDEVEAQLFCGADG